MSPRKSQAKGRATLSRAVAALYSELVESFPSGFAVLHLRDSRDLSSWSLVARNRVAARAVGHRAADFIRLPIDKCGPSLWNASGLYRDVIVRRRPKPIGFVRKPGSSSPQDAYSLTAIPLPNRCVGIVLGDATAALKATRDRIAAESRLMQICETARAILWAADTSTFEFRYVSPGASSVLGYWVERWQHERDFLRAHVHAEDWPLVQSTLARVAADAIERRLDFRMTHADGRQLWFRTHVRLVGSMGRTELRGVMIDITDQKRVELGAREFSLKVLRGQEMERKRISFELHENIAQSLGTVKWMLTGLAGGNAAEEERAKQFQECIELTQSCIEQIRSVSYDLQPPVLEMLGLVPALQWHARRFAEQSGVHVRLEAPSSGVERLGEEAEITLFRVFQECLSNVQRHARTGSARACIRFEADSIILEIEDRGVGVPPDLFQHLQRGGFGAGLLKSRESMRRLHGQLEVESNGRGTLVRATLPRPLRRPPLAATLPRAGAAVVRRMTKGAGFTAVARPMMKE
jgi:PAS domain S-box-containing protein